jgi:hypothetical protein
MPSAHSPTSECRRKIEDAVYKGIRDYFHALRRVVVAAILDRIGGDCSYAEIDRHIGHFLKVIRIYRKVCPKILDDAFPGIEPRTRREIREALAGWLLEEFEASVPTREKLQASAEAKVLEVKETVRAVVDTVPKRTAPFPGYRDYLEDQLLPKAFSANRGGLEKFVKMDPTRWRGRWPNIRTEIKHAVDAGTGLSTEDRDQLFEGLQRGVWAAGLIESDKRSGYVNGVMALAKQIAQGDPHRPLMLAKITAEVQRLKSLVVKAKQEEGEVVNEVYKRIDEGCALRPVEAIRFGALARKIATHYLMDRIQKAKRSPDPPIALHPGDWMLFPFATAPVHQGFAWYLCRHLDRKPRHIAKEWHSTSFSTLSEQIFSRKPRPFREKLWNQAVGCLQYRLKQTVPSSLRDLKTRRLYEHLGSFLVGETCFRQYLLPPRAFRGEDVDGSLKDLARAISNWEGSVSRAWYKNAIEAIYYSQEEAS